MTRTRKPKEPIGDEPDELSRIFVESEPLVNHLKSVNNLLTQAQDDEARKNIIQGLGFYVARLAADNNLPLEIFQGRQLQAPISAQGQRKRKQAATEPDTNHDDNGEADDHDSSTGSGDDASEDDTDPYRAVVAPPQAPPPTKKRKARQPALVDATLKLTNDMGPDTMKQRRNQFYYFLCATQVPVLTNNTQAVEGFTPEQAIDITNFFFHQVMGPAGLSHVASLINYYTTHKQDQPDKGLAQRAYELVGDVEKPLILQEFFGKVSQQQSFAHSDNTLFKNLLQNVLNLEVLNLLEDLRSRVQERDPEICDYLVGVGERPSRGRGWATCLNRYLIKTMGITPNAFNNLTSEANGAHGIVSAFCSGVLCLLPKGGSYKLSRYGIQKMRSVYPKLRELVPELAVVSELLRNNLYDPMVAGQPIKMAELQTTVRNASLLSRIEEAVKEGHGDTVIRGGIVEVDEAEGVMADGGVDKMAVDDDEGSGGDNCADESTFTDEEGSSRVDP